MPEGVIHRYPTRAMLPDYARAGVGLAALGALTLATDPSPLATGAFIVLGVLFAGLALQAGLRQRAAVDVSDAGIRMLPRGEELPWEALTDLRLGYFSLRRDGRRGWLELKLRFGRTTLRLDSRLDGFASVARCAVRAAECAGVALDRASVENLRILDARRGDDIVARNG